MKKAERDKQRKYMQQWRRLHPGYSAKWMKENRATRNYPRRLRGPRVEILGVMVSPSVLRILKGKVKSSRKM